MVGISIGFFPYSVHLILKTYTKVKHTAFCPAVLFVAAVLNLQAKELEEDKFSWVVPKQIFVQSGKMADSPNCDLKSLSPLQLFERVTEQGEKVRALKAGKAPKVFVFHVLNQFFFSWGMSLSAEEFDRSKIYFALRWEKPLLKTVRVHTVNRHIWSKVVTGKTEVFVLEEQSPRLRNLLHALAYHMAGSKAFISQVNLCHLHSSLDLDGSWKSFSPGIIVDIIKYVFL